MAIATFPQDWQQEAQENSVVNEPTPFSPAWYPLQSRAIGIVQGQYFPSASDLIEGVLVLDDGTIAPTNFLASSIRYLKKNLFLLESPQLWIVYPSTWQEPPYLHFTIRGVKTPAKEAHFEAIRSQKDYFSVRGLITHTDQQAGQFVVRIFRSDREVVPEEALSQNYFLMRIKGILPKEAFGQFGDLSVKREGDKLVLEDFQFVQRLLQPKKQKLAKKRSRRKGKSTTNGSSTLEKSQE